MNNLENQHTKKVLNFCNKFNVCVTIFVKMGLIWFLYGLKSLKKNLKRGFPKLLYTLGSNLWMKIKKINFFVEAKLKLPGIHRANYHIYSEK